MAEDKIRLESDAIEKIEDPVLEQLEEEEAKRAALTGHMRKGPEDLPDEEDESCEYDLEVMKPRAVDIRDLFKRTEQKIPDAWEAALGPRRPLMVFHGITPFHRRGTKPTPIWGMGYEVRLVDTDGNTIAIEPGSEVETIGKIDTSVNLGLKGGLTLEMPDKGIELSREIPGVSMTGASVHTTTDNQFSFALRLELSQLKVLAGPVGAGGARWDIYRTRERLDRFQPLVQTLFVPEDAASLSVKVHTWIKRRGKFFGLLSAREWSFPGQEFEVSLKGGA